MKKIVLTSMIIFSCFNATKVIASDGFGIIEGIDYTKLYNKTPSKNLVQEFFFYGCIHCYRFHPYAEKWLTTKPRKVKYELIPAVFPNPVWTFYAKVFYAQQEMGILDKTFQPLFDAIHKDNKRFNSVADVAKFLTTYGVDSNKFTSYFNSFSINSKISRASKLTAQYNVDGVPSVVVNSKYITNLSLARSETRLLKVVNSLLNK